MLSMLVQDSVVRNPENANLWSWISSKYNPWVFGYAQGFRYRNGQSCKLTPQHILNSPTKCHSFFSIFWGEGGGSAESEFFGRVWRTPRQKIVRNLQTFLGVLCPARRIPIYFVKDPWPATLPKNSEDSFSWPHTGFQSTLGRLVTKSLLALQHGYLPRDPAKKI